MQSKSPQDLIPDDKRLAVAQALREAFGVTEFEDVRRMTRGHTTALVLRIVVRGAPFLLKIITRPNVLISPARQVTCMRAAAEAGLAPYVYYTNTTDGISITDFVEEVPMPATDALIQMPVTLRKLHALPPFPPVVPGFNTTCTFLLQKGPAADGFLQKFQEAKILSPGETEELLAWHAQVAAVYPHHPSDQISRDLVSSHNDLFKPDNILFDGHRVWLVDWEAAFLNDRYADLAAAANLVLRNDAEETAYLHAYFGQPPDEYQRARFFLMRQVNHLFYAMVFLSTGGMTPSEPAPDFRAFHERMWAGDVNLADKTTKAVYGRLHWERLLQNTHQTRWRDALEIVSDRRARVE